MDKADIANTATLILRDRKHFFGNKADAIRMAIDAYEFQYAITFCASDLDESVPEIKPEEIQ